MHLRPLILVGGALAFGGRAAQPEKPSDAAGNRAGLLQLIHHTNELRDFRGRIRRMIADVRRSNAEMPASFWEELEREVSIEPYAQWLVAVLERHLTDNDLRQLNAVFGVEKKKAAYDTLAAMLKGKQGTEFARAVQEFRRLHGSALADEIVAFVTSDAVTRYYAAQDEATLGRGKVIVGLLLEAQQRVRARHK